MLKYIYNLIFWRGGEGCGMFDQCVGFFQLFSKDLWLKSFFEILLSEVFPIWFSVQILTIFFFFWENERDDFNCKYYEIIFSYLVIVLMAIQIVFCFVNVS